EPLLLPVRQRAGEPAAMGGKPDGAEDLADAVDVAVGLPEQVAQYGAVAFERQQDVVLDRVVVEDGRLLELAADAELGNGRLVLGGEVDTALVEQHVADVRPGLAGDDVHHGGLAGAVGADDGAHLAGSQLERQIVEGAEAVEADGDAIEIEQAVSDRRRLRQGSIHGQPHSAGWAARPAAAAPLDSGAATLPGSRPRMPLGRNNVTSTNRAPSANSQ